MCIGEHQIQASEIGTARKVILSTVKSHKCRPAADPIRVPTINFFLVLNPIIYLHIRKCSQIISNPATIDFF